MAAEKEAWVFVVDLGQTMGVQAEGRDETNLDWAMRYMWDKISYLVSLNRKTVNAGVVGFRTDETDNFMSKDEAYEHIQVLQPLSPCTMDHIRNLRDVMVPSSQNMGDAVSALIIAASMMIEFTKKLKYKRKIILVTDARTPIDDDDLDSIVKQLKEYKIELIILGIDFDDPDNGFKEENKSPQKAQNERILGKLATATNGTCANIAEAISELNIPNVKVPRPYKTYDGILAIGTEGRAIIEASPSNIIIGVERYFRTKQASPPSATTVITRSDDNPDATPLALSQDVGAGSEFAEVRMARTYYVENPAYPGGKQDVSFDSLAKGYEYGRTAVHINKADENVTNLETFKSFTIVGFVEQNNYNVVFNMGESCVTIASRSEPKSVLRFSAFVKGLHAAEAYAIGRLVPKDMKEPVLVLLIPDVEEQCLYDVPLPFSEDLRTYRFPPLDRVVTATRDYVIKHRLLPDDALDSAMSHYVDAMDLSTAGVDEEGNPSEYVTSDSNYNPLIHRIKQAVQKRAIYPDSQIDAIPSNLMAFSQPLDELVDAATKEINKLVKVAGVKKVPPKAKFKNRREAVKPLSGLDFDSLLGGSDKKDIAISKDNAIPDFKRLLDSHGDNTEKISDIVKQMGAIVKSLITEDFGGNKDDRIIEHLGVMWEDMIAMELPLIYNDFLGELKSSLISGELGGDRRDLWFRIIKIAKLGLIRKDQCEGSSVTVMEAAEFYNSK